MFDFICLREMSQPGGCWYIDISLKYFAMIADIFLKYFGMRQPGGCLRIYVFLLFLEQQRLHRLSCTLCLLLVLGHYIGGRT